ncbi:hypothetical protein [Larkinella arboricola]|uniref:Uncharacterized protein n=1 Tax=Larkinella arboricola TaxID=643671 RepID=A0A327X102_LARAB|nr:hypothetical protein [Larkinella arboricola]RAJ95879.1 hypothetical protein LX87_03629 [Larkinella arboricola]
MKFFVPATKNPEEAEKVYGILRKSMLKHRYETTDQRIYSITFDDNGFSLTETVGKPSETSGETIVAIFQSGDLYLICTNNRGVLRGMPMIAGEWAVTNVELFENAE